MKVILASDHRGYQLKDSLKKFLEEKKIEFLDVGTFSADSVDYPDFAMLAAEKVSRGDYDRGILICGSGIGMCIVANKFTGVRAALCHDVFTAEMSRKHNDSNMLVLGADVMNEELARKILLVWLETRFDGGRHLRRIQKISEIESRLGKHCQ
ncbi:MAG: ribose 5-phosphate isomerase B [Thermodesulfobacteriota bacterium]|jgi:ribose 5-phosphate isomerase B|nr:MAG: ribose 5-phosphate isomerase B [Thermodesulfobacteriota bacterium]